MRSVIVGTVLCLALGVGVGVGAAADDQVVAPIQKFIDAFNKGDLVGAAATHSATADLAIVDEVPPYLWQGPKALQDWAAALASDSKAHGVTDEKVTIGAPTRIETSGDGAYVVVPAVYAFKEHGVAMREEAHMTFMLKKESGGWLIHGWTWTGPKPVKATPAK